MSGSHVVCGDALGIRVMESLWCHYRQSAREQNVWIKTWLAVYLRDILIIWWMGSAFCATTREEKNQKVDSQAQINAIKHFLYVATILTWAVSNVSWLADIRAHKLRTTVREAHCIPPAGHIPILLAVRKSRRPRQCFELETRNSLQTNMSKPRYTKNVYCL